MLASNVAGTCKPEWNTAITSYSLHLLVRVHWKKDIERYVFGYPK